MACKHLEAHELHVPGPTQSVYREDCTQCFGSIDDPPGLDVCLYCYNGGCETHSPLHFQGSHHPLVVNIRRTRKQAKRDEPPPKISKLAILAETEDDKYETKSSVRCDECGVQDISPSGKLKEVVDGVLKASTFARQAEVKAWEQEMTACEHTLCLQQETSRPIASQDLGQCSMCELKENLWLCLQCGKLACGRAQFGGIGGNGHALKHGTEKSHYAAVKLGSITPDGTADVYCYSCDEERVDPELTAHLAHWGINIAERQKTEKSLTEMQIEQNLRWDFSMVTEDGKELKPLFGAGLTGLKNLGNSCYMNSTFQCLFALPAFQERYYHPSSVPPAVSNPAEDLETQLQKLADGLLSTKYSKPDTDVIASEHSPEIPHQRGLAPAMIKHLIGRGHEEFSTMRQQDAFEFFLHVNKLIARSSHPPHLRNPVKSFQFLMEQRLQCQSCKKVRYRTDEEENITVPVPVRRIPRPERTEEAEVNNKEEFEPVTLKECLDIFTGAELVELTCPSCGSKAGFTKQSKFKTFPSTLAINAQRFETVNWVPTKLDIPVVVEDASFDLDDYMSKGHREGEELLPEDAASRKPTFTPNAFALSQLEAMGMPRVRCEKALHATGNTDTEAAMNWLFAHMEDPDIDTPMDFGEDSASAAADVGPSQEAIETLSAMGIAAPQARKALKETDGDITRALDWVFSHPNDPGDYGTGDGAAGDAPAQDAATVTTTTTTTTTTTKEPIGSAELPARFSLSSIVCHKGSSIHAGHYVAFVKKVIPGEEGEGKQWVLFNDEKVVKAVDVEEMKKFAYVYFFERVDVK